MLKEYWKKILGVGLILKKYFKKYGKKALGTGLVILGLVALVTPFTPGSAILVFLGLELLGFKFLFVEKVKERLKKAKNQLK